MTELYSQKEADYVEVVALQNQHHHEKLGEGCERGSHIGDRNDACCFESHHDDLREVGCMISHGGGGTGAGTDDSEILPRSLPLLGTTAGVVVAVGGGGNERTAGDTVWGLLTGAMGGDEAKSPKSSVVFDVELGAAVVVVVVVVGAVGPVVKSVNSSSSTAGGGNCRFVIGGGTAATTGLYV